MGNPEYGVGGVLNYSHVIIFSIIKDLERDAREVIISLIKDTAHNPFKKTLSDYSAPPQIQMQTIYSCWRRQ